MADITNTWLWLGFLIFLVSALLIDTFLLEDKHVKAQRSMRSVLLWSLMWVALALCFNGLLWVYLVSTTNLIVANQKALEFLTGYLIEKSLSVDNLFVFYIVFHQFKIPAAHQPRVLSYGIWGAVILRLLLILLGVWLVRQFHWILYLMGVVLILTGIKILLVQEKEPDVTETWFIRLVKRFIRITQSEGKQFFIRRQGLWYATPLFLALIFIEFSDLVFALDSIPAIFAITRDPFIIWTSNIFAILGLRALYFLLSGMVERFALLKYGIALILMFVGVKMVIEPWYVLSTSVSLGIVAALLLLFGIMSVWSTRQPK